MCVVRTYVCVTGIIKKERKRENTRALSTTTYNRRIEIFVCVVRTYVCVTGIIKKERKRENTRALSTTTYNRRIEIFVCVVNVSLRKVYEILTTQIDRK